MKMQIKAKVMLMNLAIFVPLLLLVYALLLSSLYRNLVHGSTEFLLQESYNTQRYIEHYLEEQPQEPAVKRFTEAAPLLGAYLAAQLHFRIQIYDANANLLSDSVKNELSVYAGDIQQAVYGDKAWTVKRIGGTSYVLFTLPVYAQEEIVGGVRYLYPLQRENELMQGMMLVMGLVILAAIGISWGLSSLFAERLTDPIRRLRTLSEQLGRGEYGREIAIRSGDEIEELAGTFNQANQSIHTYIQQLRQEKETQKRFLDNVTHEFKTPLTAIIGYAELIPRLQAQKDVRESLSYIHAEGKRLLKLVEELLSLSRVGRSSFTLECRRTELSPLVRNALHMLAPRLEAAGIEVTAQLQPAVCWLDADKTLQVLLNVLDNVLRHSQCRHLQLSLETRADEVHLILADDGVGIDAAVMETLFEPSLRLAAPKQVMGQSNGLGLCICRKLMEQQRGSIVLYSTPGVGTRAELVFAREEQDEAS